MSISPDLPSFFFVRNSDILHDPVYSDECTKVAILWFCFVAHAVEQLGNELLLFCYHSFRIFIMQQRNFCCFAPLVVEFFHLRNILLLCYPSGRIFLIWEIFCYSATPLPQWQNFFLIWETFCYSATLLSHSSRIFPPECFSYCSETTSSKLLWLFVWLGGGGEGLN